jgi:hypothetical protein
VNTIFERTLAGVMKKGEEKHRSDTHEDEQCRQDDRGPKQESLEPVQLPAGRRHKRYLRILTNNNGGARPTP